MQEPLQDYIYQHITNVNNKLQVYCLCAGNTRYRCIASALVKIEELILRKVPLCPLKIYQKNKHNSILLSPYFIIFYWYYNNSP